MPKVTVDGLELDVPAGATVLQACELAGKEIRHFRPRIERRIIEARGGAGDMLEAAE